MLFSQHDLYAVLSTRCVCCSLNTMCMHTVLSTRCVCMLFSQHDLYVCCSLNTMCMHTVLSTRCVCMLFSQHDVYVVVSRRCAGSFFYYFLSLCLHSTKARWFKQILSIHRDHKFNKQVQETQMQYAYLSVTYRQNNNYTDIYDGKMTNCCQKVRGSKPNQRPKQRKRTKTKKTKTRCRKHLRLTVPCVSWYKWVHFSRAAL